MHIVPKFEGLVELEEIPRSIHGLVLIDIEAIVGIDTGHGGGEAEVHQRLTHVGVQFDVCDHDPTMMDLFKVVVDRPGVSCRKCATRKQFFDKCLEWPPFKLRSSSPVHKTQLFGEGPFHGCVKYQVLPITTYGEMLFLHLLEPRKGATFAVERLTLSLKLCIGGWPNLVVDQFIKTDFMSEFELHRMSVPVSPKKWLR